MSYILDALRRADAERERGAVPGLHAQPLPGAGLPAGERRPPWPVLLAGAGTVVILGLAVAVWLLWQRGPAASATGTPVQVATTAPPPPTASAAPVPPPAASVPSTVPVPAPTASAAPAAPAAPAASAAVPAPARTPAGAASTPPASGLAAVPGPTPSRAQPPAPQPPTRSVDPAPVVRERPSPPPRPSADTDRTAPAAARTDTAAERAAPPPSPAAPAAVAPERRIYAVDELPAEIRGSLPPLAISGSIYSEDPASRFLMVNGEVVREGGRLGPDVVLEQIQPKSAVLRYKGYRYRVRF